ncbi:hypothetical protein VFJ40_11830, partial [Enterococcus faecium]|nr:hypothetical protein [Enterococcus faecium]
MATILAMLEILSDTLDRFIERIKFLINMAETIKETNVEKQTTRMIVFWSFNRIRQKSPILYRWVMNAVRYEGYR